MSNQRHIRKRASLKPTSTPLNPLKTRGFGKGIQARNAQLPKSNPLQTRPFGTPSQGLSQQQETRSIEEQMEGTAQFGYNAANIQNHAPETSQRPVQRKEGKFGGWNQPPIQRVDPVMNRLNMWREEQASDNKGQETQPNNPLGNLPEQTPVQKKEDKLASTPASPVKDGIQKKDAELTTTPSLVQHQEKGYEIEVKLKSESGNLQRMDDDENDNIGNRVRQLGKYNRMTSRQQDWHRKHYGGINGDVSRGHRRNIMTNNRKYQRSEILERKRRLWDGKTRPSFTEQTWNQMLGSVNSQTRDEDDATVYQCKDGSYYPRKRDRKTKEPYVTLDHKTNWKQYILDHAAPEHDGMISKKAAADAYNDTDNLEVMSNVDNSRKNAPKGVFD